MEGKGQSQTVADLQRGRSHVGWSVDEHAPLPRRGVLRLPRLRAVAAVQPARQRHACGVAKERAAVLVVVVPVVDQAECGDSVGVVVQRHGRRVDVGGTGRKQQGGVSGLSGRVRVVRCGG